MKALKKMLAIMLSLAMVMTMLTITSFASDVTVGTVKDLNAEFSSSHTTGTKTVTLKSNLYEYTSNGGGATLYVLEGDDITLDLGGYTLGEKSSRLGISIAYGGKLTIKNGTITGYATTSTSYRNVLIGNSGELVIDGATLTGGKNLFSGTSTLYGLGAGIYNASGASTTIKEGSVLSNFTVASTYSSTGTSTVHNACGGAVYNSGTLIIEGGTFSGNTATVTYEGTKSSYTGCGGAIFNNGGTVEIVNATFTGNTATGTYSGDGTVYGGHGGAICNKGGTVSILDGVFTGNSSEKGQGGFLYSRGGYVTVSGGDFHDNTSNGAGPTLRFASSGTYSVAGGKYTGKSNFTYYVSSYVSSCRSIVTGGWYDVAVNSEYLASGYTATGECADSPYDDAKYTVDDSSTYTITFKDTDGNVLSSVSSITTNHGSKATLPTYTASDGVFLKWNTQADGSGKGYAKGSEVEFSNDTTLYAITGDSLPAVMHYFDEGEEYTDLMVEFYAGSDITLASAPTKEKKVFKCWSTQPYGEGTTYQAGETATFNDDVNLYANWTDAVAMVEYSGEKTYYASFEEARVALLDMTEVTGTTVSTLKLYSDVSVSSRIQLYKSWSSNNTIKRNVTIDLNGYTISSYPALTSGIITQNVYDTTTITDTSADKLGGILMTEGSSYMFHTPRYSGNMYYIEAGHFSGADAICNYEYKNYTTITGGEFDVDPSSYLEDTGYVAIPQVSGTYVVAETPYIVTYSTGTQDDFATMADAISAICKNYSNKGTIKLSSLSSFEAPIILNDADAKITIDLNGKTVRSASSDMFAQVTAGSLEITNGTIDVTGTKGDGAISVGEGALLKTSGVTFVGADTPITSEGVVVIDDAVTSTGLVEQTASAARLLSASASIKEGIKFTFVMGVAPSADDAEKTPVIKYTIGGTEYTADASVENGKYTFTAEANIVLNEVDKDVKLAVYFDETDVCKSSTISAQTYFKNLYIDNTDATSLITFISCSLNLSDEIQNYKDGASTISHEAWEIDSIATPKAASNKKATTSSAIQKETDKITSAYLSVSDLVRIHFVGRASAGTTITVTNESGKEVYSETFAEATSSFDAMLDKLSPLQYDDLYTATLKNAKGDILHQVTYSINSYAYGMQNDETVGDVALALYKYGFTAKAYDTDCNYDFGETTYTWSKNYLTCTATRQTDDEIPVVDTETVDCSKVTISEADGKIAEKYKRVAEFENPSFAKAEHVCAPDAKTPNTTGTATSQVKYDKHLILNSDGSYGGTLDADLYGEGAPKNGELDNVEAGYYAVNDYYNLKNSSSRVIVPEFSPYQQTMANSDGVACALMVMNYFGDTYSELDLVNQCESLCGHSLYTYGTEGTDLVDLFEHYGYSAKFTFANAGSTNYSSVAKLKTLVETNLAEGKLMLVRYQINETARWMVIIGYDNMGSNTSDSYTNDDVIILANPFDSTDHYQDGYTMMAASRFFRWWRQANKGGEIVAQELIVVEPKSTVTFETSDTDPVVTNPVTGDRHLLLNHDGSFGGAMDDDAYGFGVAYNGYYERTDGTWESNENFEYNYFAYPDFYNMTDSSSRLICENFSVFQQSMASSCGISSTMNTLYYLGYDLSTLTNYTTSSFTKTIAKDDDFDYAQEALVNIYMQGDSSCKQFKNYGGVGAGTLSKIASAIGASETHGNYTKTNYNKGTATVPYPTYASFVTMLKERLGDNLPVVVSWNPVGGHWMTIIGYDDMGTENTDDDILVFADSADSHDHFQDGYDTYPASQFYAQWWNGSISVGQAHVLYTVD